jgi:oxygen-independent coproporphyrinogen-3 oxidase
VPLGIYISIPFCRTKCSFCNFASGVFSRELFDRYIQHLSDEINASEALFTVAGAHFDREIDTIYLGGGTPSVLAPDQLEKIFMVLRGKCMVQPWSEITMECAPGTLNPAIIGTLQRCGVNRVSLGVQSFIDEESRAVGRLHTRAITLADIENLRQAGISNLSVDLIAGLPHQTEKSWRDSLDAVIATGVPHVSIYMLEVDQDSRLGREVIAGGQRYHAHHVPNDDATADFYQQACETLNAAGVQQYEISNFARAGFESKHNLKYWQRAPYLGFGVDAHSMLLADNNEAVRFATSDDLDQLLAGAPRTIRKVVRTDAEDEAFFLGLRLNRGVDLNDLAAQFGKEAIAKREPIFRTLEEAALLQREGTTLQLTDRGRLLSNEVFERLMLADVRDEPAPSESTLIAISPQPK